MPWPVYSERFLHHQAAGTWIWTVPDGRRAIVTNVDALTTKAEGSWCAVRVGPIFCELLVFPAANQARHAEMKVVAYQGEEVAITIGDSGTHVTVCGSLMTDDSGQTGPPGATSSRPPAGSMALELRTAE